MKSFNALHRNPTTSPTNITVQAMKPGQWRILDNRLPAENIAALLGVVDYDGDSYVITLIGHPEKPSWYRLLPRSPAPCTR